MGFNIFEKGDNPAIFLLFLFFTSFGFKIVYLVNYIQTGQSSGAMINGLYLFVVLSVTYGLITYNSLAYVVSALTQLATVAYGLYQLGWFLVPGSGSIMEGWFNIIISLLCLLLLWLSRSGYFQLQRVGEKGYTPSRNSIIR